MTDQSNPGPKSHKRNRATLIQVRNRRSVAQHTFLLSMMIPRCAP